MTACVLLVALSLLAVGAVAKWFELAVLAATKTLFVFVLATLGVGSETLAATKTLFVFVLAVALEASASKVPKGRP